MGKVKEVAVSMQWIVLWHTEHLSLGMLGKQLSSDVEKGVIYINILT